MLAVQRLFRPAVKCSRAPSCFFRDLARCSLIRCADTSSTDGHKPHKTVLRAFCSTSSDNNTNTNGIQPNAATNKNSDPALGKGGHGDFSMSIPQRLRQKVVTPSDAVSLVRSGDTVCVSGFVGQGSPEAVLEALGTRYEETGAPHSLTLLFGGGPGDWENKGLNHLAKCRAGEKAALETNKPMLKRTIGGHYGQVPEVEALAIKNEVEAWTLPMGSISRMIRAQATHSPGHITTIGLGTYVDPDNSGGAANTAAASSSLHKELVTKIRVQGNLQLMYKALPIQVAIIRATTADSQGNLSMEHETLLCDQKITAMAARNSGGIVIAQVKRLAAVGSLPSRLVDVPGPLVDCLVVVDEQDHDQYHPMSYTTRFDPALTGTIRTPQDDVAKLPLNERKVIARRASMALKPGKCVNLGIGLPEGVASVAAEEEMLDYVTLTTEPGVFGGLPASGREFGPAENPDALVELNQMFDFYDGGGLDICFLGAAQIGESGDVNVSRLSEKRLTGPGGFIDISQSTRNVCFLMPFTAKGLKVKIRDGSISIENEGAIKKFVPNVMEKTFSGDEAVRRGQRVHYVTERAVFRRTAENKTIELIEVAPGVDLQQILDQMDFVPVVSPDLKEMDPRIFCNEKMNVRAEMFGSLEDRCVYHKKDHIVFIDLFGITLNSKEDVQWLLNGLRDILQPLVKEKGPIDVVGNYDGFDVRKGLEDFYAEGVADLQKEFYRSVKRYATSAFLRARLKQQINMIDWDADAMFDEFNTSKDGRLSVEELRVGMRKLLGIHLTPAQLHSFFERKLGDGDKVTISRGDFTRYLLKLMKDHELEETTEQT